MNLRLTPEQKKLIEDEIKTGRFHSAEEVIGEALRTLRDKQGSATAAASNGAQSEAVREMLAFVASNRVLLEGISVKELVHEGHRL